MAIRVVVRVAIRVAISVATHVVMRVAMREAIRVGHGANHRCPRLFTTLNNSVKCPLCAALRSHLPRVHAHEVEDEVRAEVGKVRVLDRLGLAQFLHKARAHGRATRVSDTRA